MLGALLANIEVLLADAALENPLQNAAATGAVVFYATGTTAQEPQSATATAYSAYAVAGASAQAPQSFVSAAVTDITGAATSEQEAQYFFAVNYVPLTQRRILRTPPIPPRRRPNVPYRL